MPKAIIIFTNSAGALLLALASALFLINWTIPINLVPPHDPILLIPLNQLFWIVGGIALVMALICLFTERSALPIFLLAGMVINFLVYRIAFFCEGCHSLTGFLRGFSYAFGISASAANLLIDIIFGYLLGGSFIGLWAVYRLPPPIELQKMACPVCGGKVKFAPQNIGQQIPCPHCQTAITLRKPDNLKMTCVLCKGNIEFPRHAVGQKIPCPHCTKTITLLNPILP